MLFDWLLTGQVVPVNPASAVRAPNPGVAAALANVSASTPLIVGGADIDVLALKRFAYDRLRAERGLDVVRGATHIFEEARGRWSIWRGNGFSNTSGRSQSMQFRDREAAGQLLAERLRMLRLTRPVVLALPRGGVAVGFEIAGALMAPLDLLLVRKISAPGQPELAIGAVADGEHPDLVSDPRMTALLHPSEDYLETAKARALAEIERQRTLYYGDTLPVDIAGRDVVVADDGIATGATVLAALRSVRRRRPSRIILAVPVASAQAIERLRAQTDEIVCLDTPEDFYAVGQFCCDFSQLTDGNVIDLLVRARRLKNQEADGVGAQTARAQASRRRRG